MINHAYHDTNHLRQPIWDYYYLNQWLKKHNQLGLGQIPPRHKFPIPIPSSAPFFFAQVHHSTETTDWDHDCTKIVKRLSSSSYHPPFLLSRAQTHTHTSLVSTLHLFLPNIQFLLFFPSLSLERKLKPKKYLFPKERNINFDLKNAQNQKPTSKKVSHISPSLPTITIHELHSSPLQHNSPSPSHQDLLIFHSILKQPPPPTTAASQTRNQNSPSTPFFMLKG